MSNNDLISRNSRISRFLISVFLFSVLTAQAQEKTIIGWVEPVKIPIAGNGLDFTAKIDTGADYSSIDIESLELLQKPDNILARFEIRDDNNKLRTLELPVYKITRIKRHGTESQPRIVVMLDICLDGIRKSTRVSLVNRHNYKYRLLIGRKFLKDRFIVDPALKNTTKARC
jgi:hypothetical protein